MLLPKFDDEGLVASKSVPLSSNRDDDDDWEERTGIGPIPGPQVVHAPGDGKYEEFMGMGVSGASGWRPPSTSYRGIE